LGVNKREKKREEDDFGEHIIATKVWCGRYFFEQEERPRKRGKGEKLDSYRKRE